MTSLRVTVGVAIIFLEVCTFALTVDNASSINNATTAVIKDSSIFDEVTKAYNDESTTTEAVTKVTSTTQVQMNFQLPESCSDYKVVL